MCFLRDVDDVCDKIGPRGVLSIRQNGRDGGASARTREAQEDDIRREERRRLVNKIQSTFTL
jgi:hypothetical protein